MNRFASSLITAVSAVALVVACGSSKSRSGFEPDPAQSVNGTFDDGGMLGTIDAGMGHAPIADPTTCEEAQAAKTYVGCDYWPTVTGNLVSNVFDFAVAVANVGTDDAHVQVTGPNGVSKSVAVAPGSLNKIILPWVAELKGPDLIPMGASVLSIGCGWGALEEEQRSSGRRLPVQPARVPRHRRRSGQGLVEVREARFHGARLLLVLERRVAAPAEHRDDRQLPDHGLVRDVATPDDRRHDAVRQVEAAPAGRPAVLRRDRNERRHQRHREARTEGHGRRGRWHLGGAGGRDADLRAERGRRRGGGERQRP